MRWSLSDLLTKHHHNVITHTYARVRGNVQSGNAGTRHVGLPQVKGRECGVSPVMSNKGSGGTLLTANSGPDVWETTDVNLSAISNN